MIAIVNYGSGNIKAITNIFRRENVPFTIAQTPADIESADRYILPGVGAFDTCMVQLNASGMRDKLEKMVIDYRRPVIGICVGMQMMAVTSEEGRERGLGWISGHVAQFNSHHANSGRALQVPHMGWNSVRPINNSRLFNEVDLAIGYYFLHSYYFVPDYHANVIGSTTYGVEFASAIRRDNVIGVQFHPEKSHLPGIQLLLNFSQTIEG
jgi:glutamine amidotransferase